MAQLASHDEALDKSFREKTKAACGALDVDVLNAATRLFKLRRAAATGAAVTSAAGSNPVCAGGGKPSAAKSTTTLMRQGLGLVGVAVSSPTSGSTKPVQAASPLPLAAPLTRADCPDGYSSLADHPILWPTVCRLWGEKLESEAVLGAAQVRLAAMRAHLASLAAVYEGLKSRIDGIGAEREALASAREMATNDVELLVRLKRAQVRGVDSRHHLARGMNVWGRVWYALSLVLWSETFVVSSNFVFPY